MVTMVRSRALSRHPLELALLVALGVSSSFQLIQGPSTGTLSAMLPATARMVLTIVIIIGAILAVAGAIFHPKVEPLALHAELAGVMSIGLAMSAYVSLIVMEVPDLWLTSSVWTTGGIAVGFIWRGVQVVRLIRQLIGVTKQLDRLGMVKECGQ